MRSKERLRELDKQFGEVCASIAGVNAVPLDEPSLSELDKLPEEDAQLYCDFVQLNVELARRAHKGHDCGAAKFLLLTYNEFLKTLALQLIHWQTKHSERVNVNAQGGSA